MMDLCRYVKPNGENKLENDVFLLYVCVAQWEKNEKLWGFFVHMYVCVKQNPSLMVFFGLFLHLSVETS